MQLKIKAEVVWKLKFGIGEGLNKKPPRPTQYASIHLRLSPLVRFHQSNPHTLTNLSGQGIPRFGRKFPGHATVTAN